MIPVKKLLEFFTLRLLVLALIWSVKTAIRWNEIFLWLFTVGGPIMFLIQVLLCNLYLIVKPLARSVILPKQSFKKAFKNARKEVAQFWSWHGKIFHCHEMVNFHNIPNEGGAVLVFYHGVVPVDYVLIATKILLDKKRIVHFVVDKMMILMPGFEMLAQAFGCHSRSREGCVKILQKGYLIGVAPGGGYEAQLGTPDYKIMWKKRSGFAAVAYKAQVPIIPIFTENIREAYLNMQTGMWLWNFIYSWTKIPIVPVYGGFPVKLRTHVGHPIHPKDFESVDALREATLKAMESMIASKQKLPGNITRAICERLEENEISDLTPIPDHETFEHLVRRLILTQKTNEAPETLKTVTTNEASNSVVSSDEDEDEELLELHRTKSGEEDASVGSPIENIYNRITEYLEALQPKNDQNQDDPSTVDIKKIIQEDQNALELQLKEKVQSTKSENFDHYDNVSPENLVKANCPDGLVMLEDKSGKMHLDNSRVIDESKLAEDLICREGCKSSNDGSESDTSGVFSLDVSD